MRVERGDVMLDERRSRVESHLLQSVLAEIIGEVPHLRAVHSLVLPVGRGVPHENVPGVGDALVRRRDAHLEVGLARRDLRPGPSRHAVRRSPPQQGLPRLDEQALEDLVAESRHLVRAGILPACVDVRVHADREMSDVGRIPRRLLGHASRGGDRLMRNMKMNENDKRGFTRREFWAKVRKSRIVQTVERESTDAETFTIYTVLVH